jgi:hypothetical protein
MKNPVRLLLHKFLDITTNRQLKKQKELYRISTQELSSTLEQEREQHSQEIQTLNQSHQTAHRLQHTQYQSHLKHQAEKTQQLQQQLDTEIEDRRKHWKRGALAMKEHADKAIEQANILASRRVVSALASKITSANSEGVEQILELDEFQGFSPDQERNKAYLDAEKTNRELEREHLILQQTRLPDAAQVLSQVKGYRRISLGIYTQTSNGPVLAFQSKSYERLWSKLDIDPATIIETDARLSQDQRIIKRTQEHIIAVQRYQLGEDTLGFGVYITPIEINDKKRRRAYMTKGEETLGILKTYLSHLGESWKQPKQNPI